MHFYPALRGALFTAVLVILIFFLKVICPIDTGCLADPFLVIIFSPLILFKLTGLSNIISVSQEPFFILGFWTLCGLIVGYLLGPFFSARKQKEEELEGV